MKLPKAPRPFPNLKRIIPKNEKERQELAKKVAESFREQKAYLEREKDVRTFADSEFLFR